MCEYSIFTIYSVTHRSCSWSSSNTLHNYCKLKTEILRNCDHDHRSRLVGFYNITYIIIELRVCCARSCDIQQLLCYYPCRGQHQRLSERELAAGVRGTATNHHQNDRGHSARHSEQDLPLHSRRLSDIGHRKAVGTVCIKWLGGARICM